MTPKKTKARTPAAPKDDPTSAGPMKADPQEWVMDAGIANTAEVKVPTRLIDQIIGQEEAVAVALKAAEQRRHLLLIGDPGTGKSMLAKAMAEVLPDHEAKDLLAFHNPENGNEPIIKEIEGGKGRTTLVDYEKKAKRSAIIWRVIDFIIVGAAIGYGLYLWMDQNEDPLVFLFIVLLAFIYLWVSNQRKPKKEFAIPRLLIEHGAAKQRAPYIDGTGSHAGALLGDVRHDPYQSGGLETAPHQRVEVGAIHRAHNGVLFIDEINVLKLPSQQALLTVLQEGKYSIVGQSQSSAGAMVRTKAAPASFILVAAGNMDAVQNPEDSLTGETGMHPALRSRIRGYGYEVFVNHLMDDTHDNRMKLLQFVAQEVNRDGRIPHFEAAAAAEIIRESQRRAGETGKLTLRLRELGGLVRTAGDYASADGAKYTSLEHVRRAKISSRSLEQQITAQHIRRQVARLNVQTEGSAVGMANGSASIGTGEVGEPAGIVVPVEAAVVPALSRSGGALILGDGLKSVGHAGVENIGAVLKLLKGAEIANHDIYLDARVNQKDADASPIGIAAAVSAISALEMLPVRQDVVLIGSISVMGEIRPSHATLQQVESAMTLGFKFAVVPDAIRQSLLLDDYIRSRIQVLYCRTLPEVLDHVLDMPAAERRRLVERMKLPDVSSSNGRNGKHELARVTAT